MTGWLRDVSLVDRGHDSLRCDLLLLDVHIRLVLLADEKGHCFGSLVLG